MCESNNRAIPHIGFTTNSTSSPSGASRVAANLWLIAWIILACLAPNTRAAISVPTTTPVTFEAPLSISDWVTVYLTGDGTTFASAAALDSAIQTFTAADVLGNGTVPPDELTTSFGTYALARRNAGTGTLYTRPTGNAATFLMAILQNDSGADLGLLTFSYEFSSGIILTEEIPGPRVYCSLNGLAGSWILIPELCTDAGGALRATVALPEAWPAGGTMYFLWVDDNGNGVTDGYYALDNFTVELSEAPPLIVTHPVAELTVEEKRPFSLSVTAIGSPLFYQWYKDGIEIGGAMNATYAVEFAALEDAGIYECLVYNELGTETSSSAIITVNPDLTQPTVLVARGSYLLDRVVISFSERIDPASATDFANYSIPSFTLLNAVLHPTGTKVTLTLDTPLTLGETYTITIKNVRDLAQHQIPNTTLPLRAWVLSRGFAMEQLYFDIPGTNLVDLTTNPKYPDSPDQINYKSTLEGPTDAYNLYGTRLSGWVKPPQDGEFIFYFCSQDAGQLSLGLDGNPANLVTIAREISFSLPRTWTGPGLNADRGNPPSNISTQNLIVNTMYPFEVLAKASGGDNSGVNWKLPDAVVPNNDTPGIPGAFLYALADPAGAAVNITQQPANAVVPYFGAITTNIILNAEFNEDNGGFTVVNYGSPIGPWSYNAAAGGWTNHGPNELNSPPDGCGGPYASGLNSPLITFSQGGPAVLFFTHRHAFEGMTLGDPKAWDGGQVRVSVNGGEFRTLPPANFTLNGYIAPISGSVTALLTNTPGWLYNAFVGQSAGYASGNFITSVADLGFFNAGDTIVVQFLASWDECAQGSEPNWELKNVKINVATGVPSAASFTVEATSTYLGLPNSQITYVWQRDTGAGFQDILGAYNPTYTGYFTATDTGTRFRCLVYSPAASATSQVATVTVGIPLVIVRQGSNVRISWSLNSAGFELQRSPILPGATWTRIAPPYQSDGTSYYVIVPATTGNAFYRLRKP